MNGWLSRPSRTLGPVFEKPRPCVFSEVLSINVSVPYLFYFLQEGPVEAAHL